MSKRVAQTQEAQKAALQAAQFALEKKAEDVKIFDLRKLTSITDFFVRLYRDPKPQIVLYQIQLLSAYS